MIQIYPEKLHKYDKINVNIRNSIMFLLYSFTNSNVYDVRKHIYSCTKVYVP